MRYGRSHVEEAFGRDPDNRMYGSLDAYLDHWPIRHVRAGLPPFLFLIAESEQEQPPVLRTNRKFVEDARALGNWAEYRVLPGRTHYSAIRSLGNPGDPVFAIVRDFVRQIGGAPPSPPRAQPRAPRASAAATPRHPWSVWAPAAPGRFR
jgi:hypothetical protein